MVLPLVSASGFSPMRVNGCGAGAARRGASCCCCCSSPSGRSSGVGGCMPRGSGMKSSSAFWGATRSCSETADLVATF